MDGTQNDTPKKAIWEDAFLAVFARSGNVSLACAAVGINRSHTYHHRKDSPEFAARWDDAREAAMDRLEAEADRRAVEGVRKRKFHPKTGQQYIEREYSDTLLIFLLKGGRPEKYRERFEHNVSGSVVMNVMEEVIVGDHHHENGAATSSTNGFH